MTLSPLVKPLILIACAALVVGCASTGASSGGSSSGGSSSGGGMPGGGSTGGGMPGGGMPGGGMPGGGMPGGGSTGGGMPGGGMPGGGSTGGSPDGSDSGSDGGSAGGGSDGTGSAESMGGVEAPAGAGTGEDECVSYPGGIGGDINCQGESGAGGVGEFPGEGDSEVLGKELDESIGGFDEVLMEEQQEVSSVGRNTEGFGGGGPGGSGGGGGGGISLGEQAEGAMGQGGSGGGGGASGQGQVGKSPVESMSAEEVARRTPDDIEVLIDDDIIAKQLREAALVEEDPELRERLWEEYRKYRGID